MYTNCTNINNPVNTGGIPLTNINFRHPRPIYEQVRDGFRQLIITGVLPAEQKLPSVRELASQLTINPNTIQRAYHELEAEGYICSVPGRGSFVSKTDAAVESRKAELMEKLSALVKELRLLGVSDSELENILKGGEGQ